MKLDASLFEINSVKITETLEKFIQEKMEQLHRDGIVIGISGGVDSSTVLGLCTRAIGKDKVIGLIIPEKQGNPEAEIYAKEIAAEFGVHIHTIDISHLLKELGTYNFITSFIPTRGLRENLVKTYLRISKENPYIKGMKGDRNELFNRGYAAMNSKNRIRLVVAYRFAEQNNLMVVGCTHKSEDMLGFYVKFGIDNNADIMPLKNLYRSHIVQIADYIGVPPNIINRPPNPDIIPGITDKYYDVFGIHAEKIDPILFGIEHGLTDHEIAEQMELENEKISELREIVKSTSHMRNPSMAPIVLI